MTSSDRPGSGRLSNVAGVTMYETSAAPPNPSRAEPCGAASCASRCGTASTSPPTCTPPQPTRRRPRCPVLLERTPYGRRARRDPTGPQRRPVPQPEEIARLLHRRRLPRGPAGLPGPRRLRGGVREVPRRGPGRGGHGRVAHGPAVVRRQGRDDRGVLLRSRPGGRGSRGVPGLAAMFQDSGGCPPATTRGCGWAAPSN